MSESPKVHLAILTVFLVNEGNDWLMDLYLDRVHRHTSVPFTLYAAKERLRPELLPKLEALPNVEFPTMPKPEYGVDYEEHSLYLQALADAAVADGCTHFATFHVDSFPVRDHWAEDCLERFGPRRPVVAVCHDEGLDTKARPNPVMLMCEAEFYKEHRPQFTPSKATMESDDFKAFEKATGLKFLHSGVGFGFELWKTKTGWKPLKRSNRHSDHPTMAAVFGDTVFHLGAAARRKAFFTDPDCDHEENPLKRHFYRAMSRVLLTMPKSWVEAMRRNDFGHKILALMKPDIANELTWEQIGQRLRDDSEGYLRYLRGA